MHRSSRRMYNLLVLLVIALASASAAVASATPTTAADDVSSSTAVSSLQLHSNLAQARKDVEGYYGHGKGAEGGYTPSATPLILLSPEVSVWSFTPSLSTSSTRHWSGQTMSMYGALRVDEIVYEFMGSNPNSTLPQLPQQYSYVFATTTYYSFLSPEGIELIVAFSSVVDELSTEAEVQKPYSYVRVSVNNTNAENGASPSVQLYYDVAADWVLDVNFDSNQNVAWEQTTTSSSPSSTINIISNYDSIPFSERGDYIKMNWGRMFMSSSPDSRLTTTIAEANLSRTSFANGEGLPEFDTDRVRLYTTRPVSSSFLYNFGVLPPQQSAGASFMIGYDDIYSMNYFGEYQPPLWRQTWNSNLEEMIQDGLSNAASVLERLDSFDQTLHSQLMNLQGGGGVPYTILCELAYRQVTAAIKLTYSEQYDESRYYMKEISSDGDVSTIDVIYPASPILLMFAPEVLRKLLLPVLDYAMNRTNIPYNLPWTPHHLGFWPVCDITPDEQEQMPMEESGNVLLMIAGVIVMESQNQGVNIEWLAQYGEVLESWAEYLEQSLPDPGNQLCTDDFEGPSPHNINLALKGILGLQAYSYILQMNGSLAESQAVMGRVRIFAQEWMQLATGNNTSNHTLLQYNLPNSWSMKYNMLYQYILPKPSDNLSVVFPSSVIENEISYYKTQLLPFGLPLDSRSSLTKTDWTSWIGAMSALQVGGNDPAFSEELFDYLLHFVMDSPSRGIPFSDWYSSESGDVLGFRARPVQGGIYAMMLLESLNGGGKTTVRME